MYGHNHSSQLYMVKNISLIQINLILLQKQMVNVIFWLKQFKDVKAMLFYKIAQD